MTEQERDPIPSGRTYEVGAIEIQRVELAVSHLLYRSELETRPDYAESAIRYQLRTYMAGILDERIEIDESYPADWWQAFRGRWAPRWWLKRYPVQLRRIFRSTERYLAVCPHIELPDGKKSCFRFLREASEGRPIEQPPLPEPGDG